jgi:predicted ATP-grasp superfamily ATP-dependent carboligase
MQSVALSTPPKVRVSESIGTCGGALVTGADYRGLGIVRSLGRRGIPVWVMKQDGQMLGAASRYASRSLSSPSSEESRKQLDFLVNLAIKEGVAGWALFPTSDDTVTLVARHHTLLSEYYRLTTPPWNVLRWGCDKRLLYRLAQDLGVDRPWTFCPRNRDELAALKCPFPVILKPAMRLGFNRLTRDKAWPVENRASLLARYDEASMLLAPEMLMVQELLPGGGESQFSYAALCRDGVPLASVVARRTRQFPMDFGRFSTFVETIEEPKLVEPSLRLLSAMGFTGLVEVEFKRDSRDGKFKVLDVNPRVWGWHTLCGRAGVDFPHLAWLLVRGEPVPDVRARAGERWVRLGADLSVAVREILSGRLKLRSYLKSLQGSLECAMFAWDDPLPGLLGLPLVAATLGRRVLSGKAA